MSIQMATSSGESRVVSEMPADCPMLAMANASKSDVDDTKPQAGMGCCASCELCTPLAELADSSLGIAIFAAHAQPLTAGFSFISASPAPNLKPPIS